MQQITRKYWVEKLTTEDAEFLVRVFGMQNCAFNVVSSPIELTYQGRQFISAGRHESSVALTATDRTLANFTAFRLRLPDMQLVSETITEIEEAEDGGGN